MRDTAPIHASVWNARQVGQLAQQLLGDRRLVVASNRAPYARSGRGARERWIRPAGGLAAALDPVLQATGGVWVAAGAPENRALALPPGKGLYRLQPVPLTAEEVQGYYLGYANGALWPLSHLLVERASFSSSAWRAYRDANARFAASIARQTGPHDLVWLHDYHLSLCPGLLRQAKPAAPIAFFWHIPWPPHDVFRLCPQRRTLLAHLLASDLLGFQTEEFARNFINCAVRELGAREQPDSRRLLYRGRTTRIGVFPISIDYASLAGLARSPATGRRVRRLRAAFGLSGQAVGVGVDRLDYTKGILQRLRALDIFFSRYPHQRGRLSFIQVAVPNRTGLPDYRNLQREVEETVRALNARHGAPGWKPVRYIGRNLGHEVLAALYRLADFAVVSSLYDGMNLVAKEFAACQVERPGVLLLSETAGASHELEGATPINPLDPEGMAEAIREALAMPAADRRLRVEAWQAHLARHNVFKWAADVLRAAAPAG